MSIVESRNLFIEGKDFQSEVLFRNFMELMDIGILILIDDQFYEIYTSDPKSEEDIQKKWNQVKPSAVKKKIDGYLLFKKMNYMEEIFIWLRNSLYKNFSLSIHGNLSAHFNSLFVFDEIKNESIFSPWELNHDKVKEYFFSFTVYNYSIILLLIIAFIEFHHLPMSKFDDLGAEFSYLFKFYEYLMRDYARDYAKLLYDVDI